jgi:hypothetical protein
MTWFDRIVLVLLIVVIVVVIELGLSQLMNGWANW